MAIKLTLRDQVWDAVLKQILKTGQFRISELPFEEGQRHTVRRTLREMEQRDSVPHKASSASCFCGLSSVSKRLY